MEHFTPVSALLGGMLIGVSAVMMLWIFGRIAGISGIVQGFFAFKKNDFLWRLVFLLGLIAGSSAYYLFPAIQFAPRTHYPISLLILGGILVALGTKLGSGCTSGHGVCGIARMSMRSIIATCIFVLFGFLTVYVTRHIWNIA